MSVVAFQIVEEYRQILVAKLFDVAFVACSTAVFAGYVTMVPYLKVLLRCANLSKFVGANANNNVVFSKLLCSIGVITIFWFVLISLMHT